MTIKEIETRIREDYPEIRLKGLLKKRKETLKEFLVKFFTVWNDEKDTIFVNEEDYLDSDESEDEDNPSIQTYNGKRRSIGDIFMICKYYYPRCTLNQVKNFLHEELKNEVPRFRTSYCNETRRRMFYQGDVGEQASIYNENVKDEFGLKINEWKAL